jgi:hypothetical protein
LELHQHSIFTVLQKVWPDCVRLLAGQLRVHSHPDVTLALLRQLGARHDLEVANLHPFAVYFDEHPARRRLHNLDGIGVGIRALHLDLHAHGDATDCKVELVDRGGLIHAFHPLVHRRELFPTDGRDASHHQVENAERSAAVRAAERFGSDSEPIRRTIPCIRGSTFRVRQWRGCPLQRQH